MADLYANYADLAANETEGVDYERRTVTVPGATWSSIAIHGGGIEAGSGELARYVADGLMNHYEFAGIKSSGNTDLHITSTNFDEPDCVALVAPTVRTISFHGFAGVEGVAVTGIGGLDMEMRERITYCLEVAGFTVADAEDEIDGDEPTNIANENAIGAGVQLEMSRAQREAFFTNGNLSRANRDAGNYTDAFYAYANALIAAFNGEAKIDMNSINVSRRAVIASTTANVDLQVDVDTDVLATGGSHFVALVARYADSDNMYLARLEFSTAQAVTLTLRKRVAGAETLLATAANTTYLTHAANRKFTIRFEVTGTTLRAKVWRVGWAEPTDWMVTTTDTDLSAAGSIGIRSILSSSNTNTLPVVVSFDNFRRRTPQTFTVTRSTNGVTKSHSSGAAISLAEPARIPL